MYSIDWPAIFRPKRKADAAAVEQEQTPASVSPTVWSLGFTSLLTDISSEMVSSILPVYLVLYLRMSPLTFGVVDGIYQGFAALLRLVSGFAGDYLKRHKAVATFGYALSAVCRVGLLAVGNTWTGIAAVVALDRTGKGIRTAPRDALISLSTPAHALGRAFGVHRSLDAAGAMLGPLCAFLVLLWMPLRFDVIFVVSFSVAIVGVGVIGLFVPSPATSTSASEKKPTAAEALGVWRGATFRPVLIGATLLSVMTVSDSFIFLSLQRQVGFGAGFFPLLFVGVSLTTFALAAPTGRLADRRGRLRVFVAGHLLLVALYALLLLPQPSVARVIGCLALLGGYYAATDGVLAAVAASTLPRELYGSGLALLATGTNVGRLLSSLLFGLLWSSWGQDAAVTFFTGGLVVVVSGALIMLRSHMRPAPRVA